MEWFPALRKRLAARGVHLPDPYPYTARTFKGSVLATLLAAILFRYTEYRGADTAGRTDLSRFSDSAAVADYAREALAWAVSAGLLQGRSDGTLDPSGSATRAQTAVILQRLETLLEKN